MDDPLVSPSLLVSFLVVYQVVAFGRLQTGDLDDLWRREMETIARTWANSIV